ncbi:MAG: glycine cleavage system aminomethyltransferase GcvT [Rhodospirillales bacterium]|nr:glycine cleavage system aminomethyltransferase GcvT [Rhodospirillales bacterium]
MNALTADLPLRRTPLFALNRELGGNMVPFAGWEMPVHYRAGILAEHRQCRNAAALFDVSHMGAISLVGADPAKALERLVPGDILGLAEGRVRYTMFTNEQGGIEDDLLVTRDGDRLFLVVNASRRPEDLALLKAGLTGSGTEAVFHPELAQVALQGPAAAPALAALAPETASMPFMSGRAVAIKGIACFVTRSGYTGEDGFEIAMPVDRAEELARLLLAQPGVMPVGLGARDSLRLEAGLCLYGSDLDSTTTPIEAGLAWTIGKRRREEGGFPGAAIIGAQLANGPARRRVGIRPDGKAPARAHTPILAGGRAVGEITSGGFAPSLDAPIAMGYVATDHAAEGTTLDLMVRGTARPAKVAKLPFVAHRYFKG